MIIDRQLHLTLDDTDMIVHFEYHEMFRKIKIVSIIAGYPSLRKRRKRLRQRKLIRRIHDAVFSIGLEAMR